MAKLLVVGSLVWPLLLTAGWASRDSGRAPWLGATVYLTAGYVCHQRPERSFHSDDVQWPVCGRCAGLYLAAPLGALAALAVRRRGVPSAVWFVVAAVPTAVTFAVEHLGLVPVSSLTRALAALPLGAAVAYYIVAVSKTDSGSRFSGPRSILRVN